MNCAYCGKKIGVLRKLQDAEFCSTEHRRAFLKKQEDLALEFLLESRPHHEPEPASSGTVQPAAEPDPIPVVAGWLFQPIEPAATDPVPIRNARPRRMSWALILPAGPFARKPRLSMSRFAATGCGSFRSSADARRATLRSAPFTMGGPRPPVAAIRPLWIEPAREAAAGRQHASFVSCQPFSMRTEARLSKPPAAARFTVAPVLAGTRPALARSAFQLARPTHPRIEWLAKPVAAIERDHRWLRASAAPQHPHAALAPRVCGFSHAEAIETVSPRAMARPAAAPMHGAAFTWQPAEAPLHQPRVSITLSLGRIRDSHLIERAPMVMPPPPHSPVSARSRSLAAPEPEFGPARSFPLLVRSFGLAPQVPIRLRLVPAAAPASRPMSLVWKFELRLSPPLAMSVIRPDFVAHIPAPDAQPDTEPETPLPARLSHFWRASPAWVRRLAIVGSASAVLWPGAVRLSQSAPAREARAAIESRIRRRASIDIQDDFRSGLSQWAGAPNWAGSWSYDSTGFARPGRLALLSNSLPLTDYRLEFLAQIDRKAVGWVFRAADSHNYYVTKLVESRHGVATFSIVRYAVIDGREQRKMQLPVPVNAAAKTMFRVREEVRGTQFTTYLDGRVIDTWSDASLAHGGIGFFSDSGEAAYIRWVEVAQQDDFLGRLCSYASSLDLK